MSILRTSKQVAFTELLVAVEETMDDYADFAKVFEDSPVASAFEEFAQQRKPLIERLETELRLLNDLPSPPNEDKEDLGKLVHRIRAAFSRDALHPALQEMLEEEQHTLELARKCEEDELNQSERKIIADLVKQIEATKARLRAMSAQIEV
jgi:hypothetical protein